MVFNNYRPGFHFLPTPFKWQRGKERNQSEDESNNELNTKKKVMKTQLWLNLLCYGKATEMGRQQLFQILSTLILEEHTSAVNLGSYKSLQSWQSPSAL